MADGQNKETSGSKPVEARHSEIRGLWRRYVALKQREITLTAEAYIAELSSLLQESEARQLPPLVPQNTEFTADKTELGDTLRGAIQSKQADLQQAKQPEIIQANGFTGEAFETELISKPEYNGEFQDLNTLRNITAQFMDNFSLLKDSYFPEKVLTDSSADAFKQTEIARAISGIDADVRRIQILSAKLQDRDLLRKVLEGISDQNVIRERQMYFQTVLPHKLDILRNELLEKRGRFQAKKDQLTGIAIQDIPQVRTLLESMMKIYKEAKASQYSSLAEFINLRKDILNKKNIDLRSIAADLRAKHGISEEKATAAIDQIQRDVLDKVNDAITELDQTIIVFWRDQYVRNAAQALEFVNLEKKITEKTANRRDSNGDVLLSAQILDARKELSDKKGSYLSDLPDSIKNEAGQEIDKRLQRAELEAKNLLNEAKGKVKGEIEKHPQIAAVTSRINVTPGATVIDIAAQETAIRTAVAGVDRNVVIGTIPAAFVAEAGTVYEAIMGDGSKNRGRVGDKLEELRLEREKLLKVSRSPLSTRLRSEVSAIRSIKTIEMALKQTLPYLERLRDELRKAEDDLRRAGGDPRSEAEGDPTYDAAEKDIQRFIAEKEKITEKGIRILLDKLEKPFHKFDTQEVNWNDLDSRMILLKDADPALYERMSKERTARKHLHSNWMMVEGPFAKKQKLVKDLDPSNSEVTGADLEYLFKLPYAGDAWRMFDDILASPTNIHGVLVSAANFEQERGRVNSYIVEQLGGGDAVELAVKMADRIQSIFLRPSEFDWAQSAQPKDEIRQLMNSLRFRQKYEKVKAESGPESTIYGYFNEKGNFQRTLKDRKGPLPKDSAGNPNFEAIVDYDPVIILQEKVPGGDPGWDVFPGMFHFLYVGEVQYGTDGAFSKKPTYRTPDNRIVDFSSYRRPDGKLDVENMPWTSLEEDAITQFYAQMQNTAFPVYEEMLKSSHDAKKMSDRGYFPGIMNKWRYEEAFMYRLRDFASDKNGINPMTGEKNEVQRAATVEQIHAEWLLGVVDNNYNLQNEGYGNWTDNDVRDVLKAAVNARFINEKSKAWILSQRERLGRGLRRMGAQVGERIGKAVVEVGKD